MKNTVKNKNLIDKLFREGKNYSSKNLLLKRIDGENLYMVTVPTKNFKRAVDRNKIKRLLRNLVSNLKVGTFVVIYTGKVIPNLNDLNKEFDGIRKRI